MAPATRRGSALGRLDPDAGRFVATIHQMR
jgi:hypothetical protein